MEGTSFCNLVEVLRIVCPHLVSPRNEKCGELTPTQDTPIGEIVPDQLWAQCDNPKCLKWRKMSGDMTAEDLPDKVLSI